MPGYSIVNPILVIRAISNDGSKRLLNLIKERFEFGGIIDFLAGQGRSDDRAGVGINAQV